ncbi:MAG: hypothetical protein R3C14_50635 [Caldilineaceae bacterium]
MNVQERTAIYKADDGSNLKLHLFLPEQTDGQRSAILFFHGDASFKVIRHNSFPTAVTWRRVEW